MDALGLEHDLEHGHEAGRIGTGACQRPVDSTTAVSVSVDRTPGERWPCSEPSPSRDIGSTGAPARRRNPSSSTGTGIVRRHYRIWANEDPRYCSQRYRASLSSWSPITLSA